jgi:hypothetical protein
MTLDEFIAKIGEVIINPLIKLMFGVAVAYFVWGVAKYIRNADDPSERKKGATGIMWGIIGFVIMLSVYTIQIILLRTLY